MSGSLVRLGLASLLVTALRKAVPDEEQRARDAAQDQSITDVRNAFDTYNNRLGALIEQVNSGDALNAQQTADLQTIYAEMTELATALTGPADDDSDGGVISEVSEDPDGPTSPAAEAAVANPPVQDGSGQGGDPAEGTQTPDELEEAPGEETSGPGEEAPATEPTQGDDEG